MDLPVATMVNIGPAVLDGGKEKPTFEKQPNVRVLSLTNKKKH